MIPTELPDEAELFNPDIHPDSPLFFVIEEMTRGRGAARYWRARALKAEQPGAAEAEAPARKE
jgi:hypothetical protein